MLAASTNLPLDWDELGFAGSLQGEPIELIECETVNLKIPVDTEIVIEGEILPGVRKPEGPYGDWLDSYIPITDNHVFRAKAIAMKELPIYYTILTACPEDVILLGLPVASSVYQEIYKSIPTVRDVVCWPSLLQCVVQLEKTAEGQGKQAAMIAFGASLEWIKICTVVDQDVNIYDPSDVSWAIAARCCPERDVIVIPGMPSFRRDPHRTHWGRVAIDATAPFGLESEFERKKIPGEEGIRIEDYI
jgi:UbiD family decarboxylase